MHLSLGGLVSSQNPRRSEGNHDRRQVQHSHGITCWSDKLSSRETHVANTIASNVNCAYFPVILRFPPVIFVVGDPARYLHCVLCNPTFLLCGFYQWPLVKSRKATKMSRQSRNVPFRPGAADKGILIIAGDGEAVTVKLATNLIGE
jgi:hypothetical protein